MEKFIIVSANFCQSVFEKGFLQDVRHNLWRILRRDLIHPVPVPGKKTFLKQAKWLFADPGLGRLCTLALGILPDGTLKRIKNVQDQYGLTFYYEDKPLGSLWNKWNPLVTWTAINR